MSVSINECCANTGELRSMMEDVADRAADRAAKSVAAEMRLEMLAFQQSLRKDISGEMKDAINSALGMTPHEHIIAHERVRQIDETFTQLSTSAWKKIGAVLLAMGLAIAGGRSLQIDDISKAGQFIEGKAVRDESQSEQGNEVDKKLQPR